MPFFPSRSALALILLLGCPVQAGAQFVTDYLPEQMTAEVAAARQLFVDGAYLRALEVLRPLAEAGDPVAQNIIGAAFDQGQGLPADPLQALHWYERSAAQGNRQAMMNIGRLYRDGAPGLPADPEAARRWLQRSVDAGYVPALAILGRVHEFGFGGPIDLDQARTLYERGREGDDPWASEFLGHLYRLGSGVPQDMARARALYAEAAAGGLAQSMGNLGRMMEQGVGGAQDIDGAEALYRQAHEAGHLLSAYNLAWLLFENRETPEAAAEVRALCAEFVPRAEPEDRWDWFAECARIQKRMLGY